MAKVAVAQICSTPNTANNVKLVSEMISKAAEEGAELIVFPENCLYMGPLNAENYPAFDIGGGHLLEIRQLAQEKRIEVLLGSVPVPGSGVGRRLSRAVFIPLTDSDATKTGQSVSIYDKRHIFDVTVKDTLQVRESDVFDSGQHALVVASRVGKLGVAICFDVRFPELFHGLLSRGAELIAVPSAFLQETGKDHWEALMRARAIENQCYLLAAAQYGLNYGSRRTYGHSMIIDPWGYILEKAKGDEPDILFANVDLGYLKHIRESFPAATVRCRDYEVTFNIDREGANDA